jgi:hypothetical protein
MLGSLTPTPPQNYNIETFSDSPNPRPGTGLLILVRHDTAFLRLAITSQLQAMAVQINLNNRIHTICNIYIPQDVLCVMAPLPHFLAYGVMPPLMQQHLFICLNIFLKRICLYEFVNYKKSLNVSGNIECLLS